MSSYSENPIATELTAADVAAAPPSLREQVEAVREETRFEIRLLHERVNAMLAAEAFLTIAYTSTMGSGGRWVRVVAVVLSALGLVLSVLAAPGVRTTARLVLAWTSRVSDLLEQHPEVRPEWAGGQGDRRRRHADQVRTLLFFRAVPGVLAVVWTILLLCAVFLRGG